MLVLGRPRQHERDVQQQVQQDPKTRRAYQHQQLIEKVRLHNQQQQRPTLESGTLLGWLG